jgi:hypothetical protein
MTDDNMRMASFRIDKDLWAKFSAIAKRERYTVTEALTDYIQVCTGNDKLELSINTSNEAIDNDGVVVGNDAINTAIDKALSVRLDVLTHQEVRDIAAATIKDSIAFERLCDEAAVIKIAEKLVNSAFNPLSQAIAKLKAPGADFEQLVKAQIEPLADLLTELETYTQTQFKAVREELKQANSDRTVETSDAIDIPTIAPTIPKTDRDNEPEWVNTYNRRFYTKLVNDSELLNKVAEVIPQYPKDNSALADALVEVGLSKVDGTAFDSASISRIKKVVECLNP